jgi:glycosyltransferase involved in cell wall biosynthesis
MPLSERTRISVAMCTYNGERFLHQQLDSIARQTRLPDELVVCDDRSTDRTLAIVREFAASAPCPVRVFENQANLGFAANFEGAIRRCDGDLIALSDQDDVWYPTRLERSEREITEHPRAGLVFSDADLIDEQDRLLGQTIWQRLGFVGERKQALLAGRFIVLAKHRFVTGATVMFRADLRDRVLPIAAGWVHDEWITLITAAFYDLRPIDQPLIRYRIHGSQQVGSSTSWSNGPRETLARRGIGNGWKSQPKNCSKCAMLYRQWPWIKSEKSCLFINSTCNFSASGLTCRRHAGRGLAGFSHTMRNTECMRRVWLAG